MLRVAVARDNLVQASTEPTQDLHHRLLDLYTGITSAASPRPVKRRRQPGGAAGGTSCDAPPRRPRSRAETVCRRDARSGRGCVRQKGSSSPRSVKRTEGAEVSPRSASDSRGSGARLLYQIVWVARSGSSGRRHRRTSAIVLTIAIISWLISASIFAAPAVPRPRRLRSSPHPQADIRAQPGTGPRRC